MKGKQPLSDWAAATQPPVKHVDRREWWLWVFVVIITLLLTAGIASFAVALMRTEAGSEYGEHIQLSVTGLLGVVLLFDIYSLYQQFQIHYVRRQLAARDKLFRVISENAADMIAVVDDSGNRIYNSPAYEKVLGYAPQELRATSALEQVHPDDRPRVNHATEQARQSGQSDRTEYRMRHKDGTWRVIESTASAVADAGSGSSVLVIVNRDITQRKRIEAQLEHNALHDGLTDLPNRALFLDRLRRAFDYAKRHPEYKFAVLVVDIDDFKRFNDSFGHAIGDKILVEVAGRLTRSLRKSDTVSRQPQGSAQSSAQDNLARLGADEFTILIEDIHDPSDSVRVANRIQQSLGATAFRVDNEEVFASASIGIALNGPSYANPEDLLRDADTAMYRAKSLGKARCELFDGGLHESAVKRLTLETALRKALDRGEFRVFYQPIVKLPEAKIVGFEALVRWEQPNVGIVPPAQFIGVAEESGLIVPMNRWLRVEACRTVRKWQEQFRCNPPLTLSLNVTPEEFAEAALTNDIALALQHTGIEPSSVQLEIVETVAMQEETPDGVFRAKDMGLRLSIDDFGTGYSSLSRLRHFPADTLKIDRTFVSHMDTDDDNRAIVRTIVSLAQNFGMKVVAEGTERLEEIHELQNLGCDYAQGFYFSRPVHEDAALKLLSSGGLQNGFTVSRGAATS